MKLRTLYILVLCLVGSLTTIAQDQYFASPKLMPKAVNTTAEETLPMLSADGKSLFFVRVLSEGNIGGKFSGHDIWYTNRNADGSWQEAKNSLISLNNKGNNAVLGFSQSGDEVYLLNSYRLKNSILPGVSVARRSGNHWGFPSEMDIPKLKKEDFFYSAYVSPDAQVMLVSMQGRKQPKGTDEDLYISLRTEDGGWSELQHMGNVINSPGFEITPFLSSDKKYLYFASNGHGGFGDADMFVSERIGDGWFNWSKPQNLGKQINSKGFDAGLMIAPDSTAFFASNRNGGLADIFETRLLAEPEDARKRENPIVFQELTEEEMEAMQPTEQDNSMADLSDSKKEAIVVEDVYPLTIHIYFAFDSYELSTEAKDKLEELFVKYTQGEVQVELTGHTDAIGTYQYNQKLSEKRAQSATQFLASEGLAQRRMQAKGKGEDEPIASNETAKGRQLNRRVTIKVVK